VGHRPGGWTMTPRLASPNVYAQVMSGRTASDVALRRARADAHAFVTKPLDIDMSE
jgi:hypothetical protein